MAMLNNQTGTNDDMLVSIDGGGEFLELRLGLPSYISAH
jgi:hypothetical protein